MLQVIIASLTSLILLYPSTVVVNAAKESTSHYIRSRRELTECNPLEACYLVNLATREETQLLSSSSVIRTGTKNDTTTVQYDPSNTLGYSIRCDVVDDSVGESNYIKFFYNNVVHDEFDSIRYMNGDSYNGQWINQVPYLSTCGEKSVRIEGHIWSKKCFDATYRINLVCSNTGSSCPAILDRFELVDTVLRTDIMELTDYNSTTMASKKVAIRAIPDVSSCIDSVLFELDGVKLRCENYSPYVLYGDHSTTDVDPKFASYYYRLIPSGTHTIIATPYQSDKCTGTSGPSLKSTFVVSE